MLNTQCSCSTFHKYGTAHMSQRHPHAAASAAAVVAFCLDCVFDHFKLNVFDTHLSAVVPVDLCVFVTGNLLAADTNYGIIRY